MSEFNNKDVRTLEFIYGRLIEVYNENINTDYMIVMNKITNKLRNLVNGDIARESKLPDSIPSTGWTMERLHKTVTRPDLESAVEVHLSYLWYNNSPKGIFTITGLDVSHLMVGKKDTRNLGLGLTY